MWLLEAVVDWFFHSTVRRGDHVDVYWPDGKLFSHSVVTEIVGWGRDASVQFDGGPGYVRRDTITQSAAWAGTGEGWMYFIPEDEG